MILCKCGCGKEIIIRRHDKRRGVPKYINGHNKSYKGKHHSEEARQKMSEANKGKHFSEEHKKKISESKKGKHLSEEHKKKISEANKGKHRSEETRRKLSGANKNPSEEIRRKISEANKNPSEETRRKMSEAKKGEKCYNWKGGITNLPYCEKWTEELREEIRIRDGRICQNCGKKENNKKLSVHHVHYDKENCYPDLIAVCCSCNSKVNFNRLYWEYVFMSILTKRNLLNYFGDIK